MDIELVNLMVTANLNCNIDLQKMENSYNSMAKYNKHKFCGLILRLKAPKCTATLHSTGKVIILGTNKKPVAKRAIGKVAKLLKRINYNPSITNIEIKTATYAGCFPFSLKLDTISKFYGKRCYYEPELFNGLRLEIPNSKGIITLFHSGNFYITGIKQKFIVKRRINDIFNELKSLIENDSGGSYSEDLLRVQSSDTTICHNITDSPNS